MKELVNGLVIPETRERLLQIVQQMKDRHGLDGVLPGATELSLILPDNQYN
jgi:aspartate/glutamate racemase